MLFMIRVRLQIFVIVKLILVESDETLKVTLKCEIVLEEKNL